jgi:hypothetical protein
MKVNPFRPYIALALLIAVASAGCIPSFAAAPTATAQPLPTQVPPTEVPTNTPPPPTATATLPPTLTPTITPTPGPIVVNDDFSTDTGRFKCDLCVVKDGELFIGPYPATDSYVAYYALCNDCGSPTNYDMSFDARFVSGASDRGFGAILRENDGSFIDLEITTWLVYGVWHYNAALANSGYAWDDAYTYGWVQTSLKGGTQTNHVEIINQNGSLSVKINGKTSLVTIPKGNGHVGLIVGMHSLGVAFDNFHFEEKP